MKTASALLFLLICAPTPAMPADLAGAMVVIPVVGRLPGAQGSVWRTDLIVSNASRRNTIAAVVVFSPERGGNTAAKVIELQPRETRRFTDIVLTVFGYQEMSGMIEVTSFSGGGAVAARAYIYNVGSTCGEFGQTAPGVPTDHLSFNSVLADLPAPPASRTNIGITNPTLSEAPVFVSIYTRSGEFQGGVSLGPIAPRSVLQINDVYDYFSVDPAQGLTIEVRSASTALYVWASSVRNDTGDAAFIVGHDID